MKKILLLALIATVAMTACGTGSTTKETTDSTTVKVDSIKTGDTTQVKDTVKSK